MNIAVIQPQGHGSGTTTVASMVAYELSRRNRRVCLTNAKSQSESLHYYYAVKGDQENNVSLEFLNLIKFGGIQKDKVPNYCRNISDNLDLFVINSPLREGVVTEEDLLRAIEFMAESSPYDYVVYDVDEKQLAKPAVQKILEAADVCILVITQDRMDIERFKEEQEQFTRATRNIPVLVVVNRYSCILGNVKELAAGMGIRNTKNWFSIHANDYVPMCANQGKMAFLMDRIHNNQPEVVELNHDILHIVQGIMNIRRLERRQRISRQMSR